MRITPTIPAQGRPSHTHASSGQAGRGSEAPSGGGLPVPVEPARASRDGNAGGRESTSPSAAFVTQLLAARMKLAVSRTRRRGTAEDAQAAYGATVMRNETLLRPVRGASVVM